MKQALVSRPGFGNITRLVIRYITSREATKSFHFTSFHHFLYFNSNPSSYLRPHTSIFNSLIIFPAFSPQSLLQHPSGTPNSCLKQSGIHPFLRANCCLSTTAHHHLTSGLTPTQLSSNSFACYTNSQIFCFLRAFDELDHRDVK